MTAGRPRDDLDLTGRITPWHAVLLRHREANDAGAVRTRSAGFVLIAHRVAEVAEAVGGEVGVKRQPVDGPEPQRLGRMLIEPGEECMDVDERIRLLARRIFRDRIDAAVVLGDEEAVAARRRGERRRVLEPHVLVVWPGPQRRRRLGRALHGRGGPRRAGRSDDLGRPLLRTFRPPHAACQHAHAGRSRCRGTETHLDGSKDGSHNRPPGTESARASRSRMIASNRQPAVPKAPGVACSRLRGVRGSLRPSPSCPRPDRLQQCRRCGFHRPPSAPRPIRSPAPRPRARTSDGA